MVLKFIVLDKEPAKSVTLPWRSLGSGEFSKLPARLVARSVYSVTLPPVDASIEYRIEAETAGGNVVVWPATAPTMNQTVVAW